MFTRKFATIIFTICAITIGGYTQAAPEKFKFDKGHTEIMFWYSHVGNSTAYAKFDDYEGTFIIDKEGPANNKANVTIKMASINTGVTDLDKHLRGPDFFEVEKYPNMTFVSKSFKQVSNKTWEVIGDLTIKEITRPVTLVVDFNFKGLHPLSPYIDYYKDVHVAGFSANAQILRSDFGVGMFAPLTGDLVNIVIETELFREE